MRHRQVSNKRNRVFGIGSGHHPQDKARYVHANYRFLVHPKGFDYRAQMADADMPLPWDSILQILVSAHTQSVACPICLEDGVACVSPRMAKCGHLFCLPCLMRYFATSDVSQGRWRKCPICWDPISLAECRPVKWTDVDKLYDEVAASDVPREKHDVMLRLLMRKPGTTLALPRDEFPGLDTSLAPWHYEPGIVQYARFMLATDDYMLDEGEREIKELGLLAREDEVSYDGEDAEWNAKAIAFIQSTLAPYQMSDNTGKLSGLAAVRSSRLDGKNAATDPTARAWSEPARNNTSLSMTTIYFYQPKSGTHFYLSPLDIRILKRMFGEYYKFPSALLVRVEHISHGHTMDEELRRRAQYLSHLPKGCHFAWLECDWTDIVPANILETFAQEIAHRRKTNHDKDQLENHLSARQGREARVQWQHEYDEMRNDMSSMSTREENDFAWVLEMSRQPQQPLPQQKSPASSPSSPAPAQISTSPASSGLKSTVWGTKGISPILKASKAMPALPQANEEEEVVEEGGHWIQGWEEQLLEASTSNSTPGRKPRRVVLMSNGLQRAL